MKDYKKKDIVEFIYHNFQLKNGKKLTKAYLNERSQTELLAIVERNNCMEKLKNWCSRPKMIKYMVDGIKDGKDLSWDCEAENEAECRKNFEEEGITVLRIAEKSKHHRCLYCNGIALGKDKDFLCDECAELFGHTRYSEL